MTIRVNGEEYESPDAMPAGVREAYEAALRRGGLGVSYLVDGRLW